MLGFHESTTPECFKVQWRIQDFSGGGGANLLFDKFICRKLHENKINCTPLESANKVVMKRQIIRVFPILVLDPARLDELD